MADVAVRPARLTDVDAVVAVQRRVFADLASDVWAVPDLETLDEGAMSRSWERAVLLPPSSAHRVLVATAGEAVTGVAVVEPCADPDVRPPDDAGTIGELTLLVVDPRARGQGHGSRLLAAVADVSAAAGVSELVAWLPAADDLARQFLGTTGWAPDGAHRSVEVERAQGSPQTVRELRYATALTR